ncbi:MAG TPA: ChbG/HpnK family deacetylase [Candidatus Limnocylindria bacterium]|nr:ChbG/HpnK family deacetylase [Candidatus Limnocylindria bacterium]HEV8468949.1 ChbG/HpnK family deacetylase [Candidatus Limnocylindria bacterium]
MKRLIVNADDFGRSAGVDRGIIRAHREGIVTSTTFMANAPAARDAAALARATPTLDVGVHLVLTYARPLTEAARIPSLVRADGSFGRPSELLARDLDRDQALVEYRAQFARARELLGRDPTHIDTHHWVHDHPALSWAVCQLAVETRAAARAQTPRQRDEYRAKGVRTADHFVREFQHPGHIEVADLLGVIARLEDGVTELMCHPGEPDPELVATSAYARERPIELATLTDPRVRSALERDGVALTTFAHL